VTLIEIRNTHYTTLDLRMTFTFDFVQLDDTRWRVYVVRHPPYGGRPTGSVQSHRLTDACGTFICWDRPLTTLDEAKGVARAWADATQVYITTGTFPPPGPPRAVPDWSASAHWPQSATLGRIPGTVPRPPAPVPRFAPPPAPVHRSRWLQNLHNKWRNLA
jgi:hypothetical protein